MVGKLEGKREGSRVDVEWKYQTQNRDHSRGPAISLKVPRTAQMCSLPDRLSASQEGVLAWS